MHVSGQRFYFRVPVSEAEWRAAVDASGARAGKDSEHGLRWLLEVRSTEELIQRVRNNWEASDLPLRSWAAHIHDAMAWHAIRGGGNGLELHLKDHIYGSVLQQVPMRQEVAEACLKLTRPPALATLRSLALAAPGLSLAETGDLARSSTFADPLSYARSWTRNRKPVAALATALAQCTLEVAFDGLGNCFLADEEGRVSFFDHECLTQLRSCRVSVTQLIEGYFEDPLRLFNESWLGVQNDTDDAGPVGTRASFEKAWVLCSRLDGVLALAVAVRCCMRAAPTAHMDITPREWHGEGDELAGVLNICQRAVASGVRLAPNAVRDAKRTIACAKERWSDIRARDGLDEYVGWSFATALEMLCDACAKWEDPDAVLRAVNRCIRLTIWKGIDVPGWYSAVILEASELAGLGIGAVGTRAVPAGFFDRPLWLMR